MRLTRITLQHFRNIKLAELPLRGRQHFFVGENAQGKTNLLEAIGFITALRSFRTSENKLLIEQGEPEAAIACELEHERFKETRVVIRLRAGSKEVVCDNEKVTRMGEYLGRFPTVVFSSQDQQLVRGAPAGRRRWVDLTLAAMDEFYLRMLQQYHRALAERNALLKRGADAGEIEAFEKPLAVAAAELVAKRAATVAVLSALAANSYADISLSAETAEIIYQPDGKAASEQEWLALFAKNRPRDLLMKATTTGPHRDDYDLRLAGRAARDFGSEGQQRSLVLSLRLAQLAFFRERSGVEPILLADDVLGELDPGRRARFWATIGTTRQVIATGTRLPESDLGAWQIFQVRDGAFVEESPGA
ncbi:MAG TPA: DNA replication and repair protein RecF [Opitutaceae bacterium]|nr:DNA replication and repair protein RecF [Opitutaceae bacterium]